MKIGQLKKQKPTSHWITFIIFIFLKNRKEVTVPWKIVDPKENWIRESTCISLFEQYSGLFLLSKKSFVTSRQPPPKTHFTPSTTVTALLRFSRLLSFYPSQYTTYIQHTFSIILNERPMSCMSGFDLSPISISISVMCDQCKQNCISSSLFSSLASVLGTLFFQSPSPPTFSRE